MMVREYNLVLTHEESSDSASGRGGRLHVQTIQEDLGQHQQLGEVVETKVDHHTSKTHNLGGGREGGREGEGSINEYRYVDATILYSIVVNYSFPNTNLKGMHAHQNCCYNNNNTCWPSSSNQRLIG